MTTKALAIDLGGTNLRLATISIEGEILDRFEEPTNTERNVDQVFEQIRKGFDELRERSGSKAEFLGTGMGLPGFYEPKTDTLLGSPHFPEWKGVHVAEKLRKVLSLPVVVGNDANCAALGEKWVGKGKGIDDLVFITIGTGIGGGIITGGKLLTGSRGAGAELGHVIVDPDGPVVGDGVPGSVESMTSGTAFKVHYKKSLEEMTEEARKGDEEASRIMREMGLYLGRALANYAVVLDPEVFLIGGKGSLAFDLFEESMRKEFTSRLKNHPSVNTPIERALCGDDAGLFGAAYLVLSNTHKASGARLKS